MRRGSVVGLLVALAAGVVVSTVSGQSGRVATRSVVIGHSVGDRPIVATLLAGARARRTMLVVGSIAGDEPGGTSVAKALASLPPVAGLRLWVIPDMNPDGAARGTRANAHGVDLNRNFPYRWRRLSDRSSRYYPGPRPASEPESRAVAAFISRIRPGLAVWLHQPYALVDDSQGALWAERFVGRSIGLPLRRLPDYPGSAIGWENHLIRASAFDVELPGSRLSPAVSRRYAEVLHSLARAFARRGGAG